VLPAVVVLERKHIPVAAEQNRGPDRHQSGKAKRDNLNPPPVDVMAKEKPGYSCQCYRDGNLNAERVTQTQKEHVSRFPYQTPNAHS